MINPQNKDEECFKWAATGALRHKVIKHYLERIILLKSYEKQYNWKGLKFPESIMKIDKLEKSNPGIAVTCCSATRKIKIYIQLPGLRVT